ncbi:MAG: hypothetical protein JWL69_3634 [Phycisphaerales bacterium]|nr:hypothetical protein [Phycisphaerales bacterium]
MGDYWITTHWPTPVTDLPFSRHVFVKANRVRLPQPGDVVFVRQAKRAVVKGIHRTTAIRHHAGRKVAGCAVPDGTGGIIGVLTVDGDLRPISRDDVVFDYGDLDEWKIVPGNGFRPATLTFDNLLAVTRMPNARGMNLWHMRDSAMGKKLYKQLRF